MIITPWPASVALNGVEQVPYIPDRKRCGNVFLDINGKPHMEIYDLGMAAHIVLATLEKLLMTITC